MRNLRNVHRSLLETPKGLTLTASTFDVESNSIICAFGPTQDDILIQLKRWKNVAKSPGEGLVGRDEYSLEHITSWDAPCPIPDLEYDQILDIHCFEDNSTVCLVFAGGDIVVAREFPEIGEEKIEIVGSVDAGISAAAWSPEEGLLAIATRARTFLFMTRDFENVADVAFSADDLKASKHVDVGWGKKETQFKGKRARTLRDPTMPETVDEGTVHELDRKNTVISWRGDGAYVAVHSLEPGSRRVIRVYSREGALDSASEPVDGLIGALSWRPAGNLMTSIQRLKDRIDVVFFERNGLRHGNFTLRISEAEMKDFDADISLKWNVDSSVLAVCFKDRVQLWTMGNYHYYLKQEIYGLDLGLQEQPLSITWHPEKPLTFVLSSAGGIQELEYNSVVATDSIASPLDYGIVAVIDGKILKLTPLRLANIPPPMAFHEISLNENALDVSAIVSTSVASPKDPVASVAILHHDRVSFYEWPLAAKPSTPPFLKWSTKITSGEESRAFMLQQVVFDAEKSLTVLASTADRSEIRTLDILSGIIVDTSIFPDLRFDGLIGQGATTNGGLSRLIKDNAVISKGGLDVALILPFPANSSHRIEVVGIRTQEPLSENGDRNGNGFVFFGLSHSGLLSANGVVLARNCTSFLVSPAHLIFTTGQHLLKFVHMAAAEDLDVPPDTPELDERCRSIERGAKLVTVMPSLFALVMQMPRGNIETIYPRALVLAGIRQSINEKNYKKAFLACRSHRVDMNILHDHDPSQFTQNISLFVDQVEKVEYIDLFLSQLKEEDVSKTMYKETLHADGSNKDLVSPEIKDDPGRSKVNKICDTFLQVLHIRAPTRYQNIITAHVCKLPPDLDAGLTEVARIQKQSPEEAEKMVEHICFLADVNKLYDNALGLYDLDLTLLVAQQSQKDPREYLPFLQSLQEMPQLRRQFSIDNHLGRYGEALKNLHQINALEEIKGYMLKHSLYTEALELYRYRPDELSDIMRLYADYLRDNSKPKEAGIAYEYLQNFVSASECYRIGHHWRESLTCATLAHLPESQLLTLAQTLANTLLESKDYFSAATIHLDYLFDISTSSRLFCKGYFFADALRIISLHKRNDLLESIIDTGLVEGMSATIELLADCKSQLLAQVPRIRELRLKKAEDPLAFLNGDVIGGGADDLPDNVSLAPTDATTAGNSLFTRYTNRGSGTLATNATRQTSKNRRREERKRARGKKGSVYEEEYLVNSVLRLVERVNSVGDEVSRLISGLMRRRMRERARAVEYAMVELISLCRVSAEEIFPKNATEEEKEVAEMRPKGGEGVLWDSIEGSDMNKKEMPIIKGFEKLSLL